MTLLETLALLTFVLTLLSLIVDVIRLTVEVMDKNSQKKNDNKKARQKAGFFDNLSQVKISKF